MNFAFVSANWTFQSFVYFVILIKQAEICLLQQDWCLVGWQIFDVTFRVDKLWESDLLSSQIIYSGAYF